MYFFFALLFTLTRTVNRIKLCNLNSFETNETPNKNIIISALMSLPRIFSRRRYLERALTKQWHQGEEPIYLGIGSRVK